MPRRIGVISIQAMQSWTEHDSAMDPPSWPTSWNLFLRKGRFSAQDSETIKTIIDKILDTYEGAYSEEMLRLEMEFQKDVFVTNFNEHYTEYELFLWSFEEKFEENAFINLWADIVAEARKPDADVCIIAQAACIKIRGY